MKLYCFDDSKVTQIDPSHMSKKDAYILFYEKFELQLSDPNLGVENEQKDHVEEPCTIHPTEKDLTRKRERVPSQKVRDNMSTNASKLCEEKIGSETSDLSTKQSDSCKVSDTKSASSKGKKEKTLDGCQSTNPEVENKTEVYCICKTSDTSGVMIACEKCINWFHTDCISYVCPDCEKESSRADLLRIKESQYKEDIQ